jgi:Tfp pilus assembly protein PilZ
MERRTIHRVPTWLQVRIVNGKSSAIGLVLNLSHDGMYIECDAGFSQGSVLELRIHMAGAGEVAIPARVVWISKIGSHVPGLKFRMGLTLADDDRAEVLNELTQASASGAFEALRLAMVDVFVEDHKEMQGVKAFNLSDDGCYIALETGVPKVGDDLVLVFNIPGAPDPLRLRSNVIYSLDDDDARTLGIVKGFGVRFTDCLSGQMAGLDAFLGKKPGDPDEN